MCCRPFNLRYGTSVVEADSCISDLNLPKKLTVVVLVCATIWNSFHGTDAFLFCLYKNILFTWNIFICPFSTYILLFIYIFLYTAYTILFLHILRTHKYKIFLYVCVFIDRDFILLKFCTYSMKINFMLQIFPIYLSITFLQISLHTYRYVYRKKKPILQMYDRKTYQKHQKARNVYFRTII